MITIDTMAKTYHVFTLFTATGKFLQRHRVAGDAVEHMRNLYQYGVITTLMCTAITFDTNGVPVNTINDVYSVEDVLSPEELGND